MPNTIKEQLKYVQNKFNKEIIEHIPFKRKENEPDYSFELRLRKLSSKHYFRYDDDRSYWVKRKI